MGWLGNDKASFLMYPAYIFMVAGHAEEDQNKLDEMNGFSLAKKSFNRRQIYRSHGSCRSTQKLD